MVTTNELGSLHATKRTLEYLEHSGVPAERPKLLVTRYTPATGLKSEDVKTALHLSPFALLNNDYEVLRNAVLEGQPAPAGSGFAEASTSSPNVCRASRQFLRSLQHAGDGCRLGVAGPIFGWKFPGR